MAAIDVGEDDFQREVLERSATVPVVVDFWAPWCGPCRSFGPVLERAAEARPGAVALVKIDTEANPSLAGHFEVHGIPAVKVFRRREVVAQFVGARAPAWVERFLDGLAPSEIDELVEAGDESSLRRAVELDPRRSDAAVGLARILRERGEPAGALELLKPVGGSFRADGLAARIRLDGAEDADLAAGFRALDAGQTERALDLFLTSMASTPGHEADVRQLIASLLADLGFGHPLAGELRRRLASPARR